MNIKILCACGAKYSFDVEPVDGRMPFTVQCPTCQKDGTAAANEIIAQSTPVAPAPPSALRIHLAHPQPAAAPETASAEMCHKHSEQPAADHCFVCGKPICLECMSLLGYLCSVQCKYTAEQRGLQVPAYQHQKIAVERRYLRKAMSMIFAAGGVVVALLCFGLWYSFSGTHPHPNGSIKLNSEDTSWQAQYLGPGQLLVFTGQGATLRDLRQAKDLWQVSLADSGGRSLRQPELYVAKDRLWFCNGLSVKGVNRASGAVERNIPIQGVLYSFTPAETNLLIVSATAEDRRNVLSIDLASGESASRQIVVPRNQKQVMPDDLPANVAPTAAVLLARELDDEKHHVPTVTKFSSEFFPAGDNLVEFRVQLLEPKLTYVESIKPKGPTKINGGLTASANVADVATEVFNDIKRSNTGGVRPVDESRYRVMVRRWLDKDPVVWQSDGVGPPCFFPEKTVDLVVEDKILNVLDKQNKKLFDSKLSYPLAEEYVKGGFNAGLNPGLEDGHTLYFFDQAVLTAFELPGGNVRWRLTSVGINQVLPNHHGALYVATTSAGPENIQYSDQITMGEIEPVLLKVDETTGKILWKAEKAGSQFFLTDKYVYAANEGIGGMALTMGLSEALGQPSRGAAFLNIYRLDPATGKLLWGFRHDGGANDFGFQDNHFFVVDRGEISLFKYLDWF